MDGSSRMGNHNLAPLCEVDGANISVHAICKSRDILNVCHSDTYLSASRFHNFVQVVKKV